jgi:heme/copper-type cytochrome/quinol oxidase subunit 2
MLQKCFGLMNLLLRPLNDINDPTWSVIFSIMLLLVGVFWVVRYILLVDTREAQEHGSDDTPEQEELLQLPSDENK